jgi:hypothetical protein
VAWLRDRKGRLRATAATWRLNPASTDAFGPEGVAVDALTAAPPPPAAYAEDLILEATAVRDSLGCGTS